MHYGKAEIKHVKIGEDVGQESDECEVKSASVLTQGDKEALRLSGVGSPKSFRRTCLKAQRAADRGE